MERMKRSATEEVENKENPEIPIKRVKESSLGETLDFKNNYDKVIQVIQREFQSEICNKQNELHVIQQRLLKAQKTLHLLRYVIIKAFYDRKDLKFTSNDESSVNKADNSNTNNAPIDSQSRIHPAVKKLIGKKPLNYEPYRTRIKPSKIALEEIKKECNTNSDAPSDVNVKIESGSGSNESVFRESTNSVQGISKLSTRNREKSKHRLIVGNISKWMPAQHSQDNSTHKWMVYVRGPKENPDPHHIVKKVRFFLHPSYQPNDIVDIEEPPFHLSRRGWGEFPLRVQVHFQNSTNKPVDVIHNLKLDRTFTGRQTLGNETVIDVMLLDKDINEENMDDLLPPNKTDIKIESASYNFQNNKENWASIPCDHVDYFSKYNVEDDKPSYSYDTSTISENDRVFCSSEIWSDDEFRNEIATEVVCDDLHLESESTEYKSRKKGATYTEMRYGKDIVAHRHEQKYQISLLKPAVARRGWNDFFHISPNKSYLEDHCYTRHIMENEIEEKQCNSIFDKEKYKLKLPFEKFSSSVQLVFSLFKHLPIVTELANDYNYTFCYPYVAANLEEFASWNLAKRCCAEWFRAKQIKRILEENNIPDHHKWSVKIILMFGRAHTFTPFASYHIFNKSSESGKTVPEHFKVPHVTSTLTQYVSSDLLKQRTCITKVDKEDCIVDVETVDDTKEVKPTKHSLVTTTSDLDYKENQVMKHEVDALPCAYVRKAAKDIGINLEAEEILPDLWYKLSERVLVQSVKCLAEELIRKAVANNVVKSRGRKMDSFIDAIDVYNVLLGRPEFDIFLNVGLGKEIS